MPIHKWEFIHDAKIPNFFNESDNIAVVKFQNNGSLDEDLIYSINVNTKEEESNVYRIFNGFFRGVVKIEETSPSFLPSLQWAIDKAYMERLSDVEIGQPIQLNIIPRYISHELRALQKFLIICTIIAPLPFFLINSSRLIDERRTGIKERMKLAGVSRGVLRCARLVDYACVAVIYAIPATLILKGTRRPILPFSNPVVIGITLVLHYMSCTTLSFITTTLSDDFNFADTLGLFFYISAFFLDFLWYSYEARSITLIYIICTIIPHSPIYMFWDEVLYLEQMGIGIQFWNLGHKYPDTSLTVFRVWTFFVAQFFIVLILSWYLDLVRPGSHGISRKWNFMFKKRYWFGAKPTKKVRRPDMQKERKLSKDEEDEREMYFEKGPKTAEVAVKIMNVTKIFRTVRKSKVKALDNVSFDCYKGEVTVVLGVNGAGKTTLMSIITGMYSPSKGAVFINNKDVTQKLRELRETIGFCPQYDLSFSYLTVKENVQFYQKLKTTKCETDMTTEQLLKKLRLKDKAHLFTQNLSSGMLRCLQVACSLVTGAKVLVLDEPTSGMDVEIRHHLWDLFMVLRGTKTIIMTTTCMEEATALGDRIVILNKGQLRCHGTPLFLQQALGVSCNLSVTITDSTHMIHLIDLVQVIVPHVEHRIEDIHRVTFSLPSEDRDKFSQLFKVLESNKDSLGIMFVDVGMYMEEVFLEFLEEETDEQYDLQMSLSCRHMEMNKVFGIRLLISQLQLLIERIIEYRMLNKYQFFVWQVVLPIVGFLVVTLTTNDSLGFGNMFTHYEYHGHHVRALVYNPGPFRRSGINESVLKHPELKAVLSDDVDREFSDPTSGYMNSETMGIKLMQHYTRLFHPKEPNLLSESINLYSNIYMSVHIPYLNHSIITSYEPIRKEDRTQINPKSVFLCLKWAIWVVFFTVVPLAPCITLTIKEYANGIRDNHMMAGCSPIVHWGARFILHMTAYLAIIPGPLMILSVGMDFDETFTEVEFLGAVAMILVAFGAAYLAHLFFLSFIFQGNYAICQVYIMSICFGTILPITLAVLEPVWKRHMGLTFSYLTLTIVARISPLFAFTVGLARVALLARSNALCAHYKHMCPDLKLRDLPFNPDDCCRSELDMPFKYMEDYVTGLHDFLTLIIQFFIYSVLVILLEHRIPQYMIERIMTFQYRVPRHKFFSISVSKEADYVRSKLRAGETKNDVILAHNLHKTFNNIFNKKKCEPIKGISFAGKLGECIGIVGPRDVGKSTLLKMLSGLMAMTRGTCVVQGHHVRKNRLKYMKNICYSSGPFGLDPFRTGVHNLSFLAQLQGYSKEMAVRIALMSLHFMGLQANLSAVRRYSSGCARRLGLCVAMILAPSLAILDEPMRDVDPNSRSRVAKALQRLVLEPAVVIVAEASVDWGHMESVYTRIAILSQGELAALGPAGEIHAKVANGYTARIKLKMVTAFRQDMQKDLNDTDDVVSSSSESQLSLHTEKSVMHAQGIVAFKMEFKKIFEDSYILGEHLCMIYFHIEDLKNNIQYSEMFEKLENLKARFKDVVEDYVLSTTTIEDVFWRLRREGPQEAESDISAATSDNYV
ncbi:ATP-binding cassette sub-family A member 17-like isoform X2 [Trichoplusia ni]|nr:ATP-binding cassette sub-family A member 17-like isoform X2 [Trichoplusia ni]